MECPTVAPLELVSLFSILPSEPAKCKCDLYVFHICDFRVAGLIEYLSIAALGFSAGAEIQRNPLH